MSVTVGDFELMAGPMIQDHEITQAEFARRVGCTRQNINKLVLAGKIKKYAKGRLKFYESLKAYQENTDPGHHERLNKIDQDLLGNENNPETETPAKVADFKVHRSDKERANAKLASLKADQLAGELISAKQVEKDAFNMARGLRDAVMAVPERVAPIVAAEKDDRRVAAILIEELEKALNGLINTMQAKSGDA